MARTPITPSSGSLVPVLGAGWYFPIARDGSLDHRFGDVTEAVRAATVDKLTVANPAHLALPG